MPKATSGSMCVRTGAVSALDTCTRDTVRVLRTDPLPEVQKGHNAPFFGIKPRQAEGALRYLCGHEARDQPSEYDWTTHVHSYVHRTTFSVVKTTSLMHTKALLLPGGCSLDSRTGTNRCKSRSHARGGCCCGVGAGALCGQSACQVGAAACGASQASIAPSGRLICNLSSSHAAAGRGNELIHVVFASDR